MNSLLRLCLEGLHTIDSVFGEETESFDRNRDRKMKELSSQFYFLRESSWSFQRGRLGAQLFWREIWNTMLDITDRIYSSDYMRRGHLHVFRYILCLHVDPCTTGIKMILGLIRRSFHLVRICYLNETRSCRIVLNIWRYRLYLAKKTNPCLRTTHCL